MGRTAIRRLKQIIWEWLRPEGSARRVIWLILVIWLYSTEVAQAQVTINEFLPDPIDDNDTSEWIELYNTGTETINLIGWTVDDEEGGTKPYSLPEKNLNPGEFFVVEKIDSHIGLNNFSDQVRLFNGNELVEAVNYSQIPEGKSFGKVPDGTGTFNVIDSPTKGERNQTATEIPLSPSAYPTETRKLSLTFTEIFGCPETGQKEGAVILNSGSEAADLTGVKITDLANNEQTLTGTAESQKTTRVEWDKSFINNDGDELKLIDQDGAVLDQASFTGCLNPSSTPKPEPTATPGILPTAKPTATKTSTPIGVILGSTEIAATKSAKIATGSPTLWSGIIDKATQSAEIEIEIEKAKENEKEKEIASSAASQKTRRISAWLFVSGGICFFCAGGYKLWRKLKPFFEINT